MKKSKQFRLGHCPVCDEKYQLKITRLGKNAIRGLEQLARDEVVETYREIHVLLMSGSRTRLSVCNQCLDKMDEAMAQSVFSASKQMELTMLEQSSLTEEQKKTAKQEVERRTMLFWSKEEGAVIEKAKEIFKQ